MAFEYGSIDLGLRNPFKAEGRVTAVTGSVIVALGVIMLGLAAARVQQNSVEGWIYFLFSIVLLAQGFAGLGKGIFATLRFFVGRNHPTSLARNVSSSEKTSRRGEASYVAYSGNRIEEMLMGRKNPTFVEPKGFLARLVHSILPRLLFMPIITRNLAQRLFGACINTLVALVAYALVAFVTLAGFVGPIGQIIFPVYSLVLVVYLLGVWWSAGRPLSRNPRLRLEGMGSTSLAKLIAVAVFVPVVIGLLVRSVVGATGASQEMVQQFMAWSELTMPFVWLATMLVLAVLAGIGIVPLLKKRLEIANPVAEVSELRENWQESVHPNEIFINLDNLVMANRRYKEVPNRVYKQLEPDLHAQVEGKGEFSGSMIQEVQPYFRPMELGDGFERVRLCTLLAGKALALVAAVVLMLLAFNVVDLWTAVAAHANQLARMATMEAVAQTEVFTSLATVIALVVFYIIALSFGRLLSNTAHVFYAEMQFESRLIYFSCEGTFTESRISTGKGVYDSTQSENTLVRSSITPWVIVTRLVTTTFAAVGARNMEFPRYILEIHKDDDELESIRQDVISFLKDRESIASITSERDLGNASDIHQLNQQTRASIPPEQLRQDAEAVSYLRQQEESNADDPDRDQ